jgi:Arc/MetJ-type ribon-helix-helix transcriptional regulator
MKRDHERPRRRGRVAEPVQVYLERPDRERLDRLAAQLDASKSDVLRQGLAALERALGDPATHPALRLIALAERETAAPARYDVAREHDRALSDAEVAAWRPRRRKTRAR